MSSGLRPEETRTFAHEELAAKPVHGSRGFRDLCGADLSKVDFVKAAGGGDQQGRVRGVRSVITGVPAAGPVCRSAILLKVWLVIRAAVRRVVQSRGLRQPSPFARCLCTGFCCDRSTVGIMPHDERVPL